MPTDPAAARRRSSTWWLAEPIRRIPPIVAAGLCCLAVAALGVLGVLQRTAYPEWLFANLDSESAVGKWVASGILWAAAAVWFLVATAGSPTGSWGWVWWPVLAWLAADEGNAFHERIERALAIDWQFLYAPLIGLAAAAWWGVIRAHRATRTVARLLVLGGAAWATSLVLELVQNWGGQPIDAALYDPMMIAEEILEMLGASAIFVAGLVVLRNDPGLPDSA